jgi:two-component system, NtrC family, response regulator AtoC
MSDELTLPAAGFIGSEASRNSTDNLRPGNGSASSHFIQNGVHATLRSLRAQAEIQAIRHALDYTGWNRKRAASLLKISYRGLLYKIRYHNITRAQ